MKLDEAKELMEWVKAIEETDDNRYPLELGDMGRELATKVRSFVEREAELGSWYTDLMAALGEDEVDAQNGHDSHGAYLTWMRDAIARHCDKDGTYKVPCNPSDSITAEQFVTAIDNIKSRGGHGDPYSELEDMLLDEHANDIRWVIETDLASAPEDIKASWINSRDVWRDIVDAGYAGYEVDIDRLLANTSFDVEHLFDDEGDRELVHETILIGQQYLNGASELADAGDLDELETDARDGSSSQEAAHVEDTVRPHGEEAI